MSRPINPVNIDLIGFPMDLGAGRRGVDVGAAAMRIAGVTRVLTDLGHAVRDRGNVEVPQPETLTVTNPRARYLPEIREASDRLYGVVRESLAGGQVPLMIGGDHSMAMATIGAVSDHARACGERLGVVWLDAHGDMNTPETSPTGNIHGMPLAVLLGHGPPELLSIAQHTPTLTPDQVALIGVRDIDGLEAQRIRRSGVWVETMRHVDEVGMPSMMQRVLKRFRGRVDRLHVSFDVDYLDPSIAPGVGTPVRGGPTYREAHLCMEMLSETGLVGSVDLTELNPILDVRNQSAELCVELLASLFGKRLL